METGYSYRVQGSWEIRRNGLISAEGVEKPKITFSSPVEFKGESGHWTPEHFLVAAIVSCYVVTFSAIAEMSKLNLLSLEVSAEGKLGKVDGKLAFVKIVIHPQLVLCSSEDHDLGHRLLKKAEQGCLIARSLACPVIMEATVCSGDRVRLGSGDLVPAN